MSGGANAETGRRLLMTGEKERYTWHLVLSKGTSRPEIGRGIHGKLA